LLRVTRSGVIVARTVVTGVRLILISGLIVVRRRSSASFLAWGCIPVLIQAKPISEILVALLKNSNTRAENKVLCTSSRETESKGCIVSRCACHAY
jgi:hypothetical protein